MKLKKIQLQGNAERLSNEEMKTIVGGLSGDSCMPNSKTTCSGTCVDDYGVRQDLFDGRGHGIGYIDFIHKRSCTVTEYYDGDQAYCNCTISYIIRDEHRWSCKLPNCPG